MQWNECTASLSKVITSTIAREGRGPSEAPGPTAGNHRTDVHTKTSPPAPTPPSSRAGGVLKGIQGLRRCGWLWDMSEK